MPNKTKLQRGCLRWGIMLLIGCMVLLLANCGLRERVKQAEPYTKLNKGTLIGMGVADLADLVTTKKGLDAGAIELNPIVGENPEIGSLILLKVTSFGIKWVIGHLWHEARDWLWGGSTIVTGAVAINNYNVWKKIESRE